MSGGRHVVAMFGFGSILFVGCAATGSQLTRRASFDLNCSKEELRYYDIDERTQGVAGCGKRATYMSTCDHAYNGCTWALNGAIESSDTAPPPVPPRPKPVKTDHRE